MSGQKGRQTQPKPRPEILDPEQALTCIVVHLFEEAVQHLAVPHTERHPANDAATVLQCIRVRTRSSMRFNSIQFNSIQLKYIQGGTCAPSELKGRSKQLIFDGKDLF